MYLAHESEPYPLPKVLMALHLKNGSFNPQAQAWLTQTIGRIVTDPVFLEILS